jgi:cellulose synthase/poly-beta-1,6-N-acetylglucosamine synthase-like glycosyltransferase
LEPSEWDALQFIALALGLVGLLHGIWALIVTWENARFFLSRLRTSPSPAFTPRVQLFVPCKGVEFSFGDMLNRVLNLDYPDYRVTFVVEATSDPAYAVLKEFLADKNQRGRLVVVGPASTRGQKVHNLLAATAQLDEGVEVLAFLDSDTVPNKDFLRRLVGPLARASTGVVTGYRWFLSSEGGWAGIVLAALNANLVFALGNHRWNPVWGGAWAMRRETFARVRADGIWEGALTEDLPVGQLVRSLGQRVVYEPGCLMPSPVRTSFGALVEFARRQYLITRVYAPGLWWLALATTTLFQGIFWGGIALTMANWQSGRAWGWIALWHGTFCGLHAARAWLRQRAAARCFPGFDRAAWLDILAFPLLSFGHWLLLLSSAFGRVITWRAIRYRLVAPGQTEVLSRRDSSGDHKVAA